MKRTSSPSQLEQEKKDKEEQEASTSSDDDTGEEEREEEAESTSSDDNNEHTRARFSGRLFESPEQEEKELVQGSFEKLFKSECCHKAKSDSELYKIGDGNGNEHIGCSDCYGLRIKMHLEQALRVVRWLGDHRIRVHWQSGQAPNLYGDRESKVHYEVECRQCARKTSMKYDYGQALDDFLWEHMNKHWPGNVEEEEEE